MKTHALHAVLTSALSLIFTSALVATPADGPPSSFADALKQGDISLNIRARHEGVDQTGLKDANALTLRTRLGFSTAIYQGLKAMIEFENIVSPDGDRYNQSGINPGGAGRAVVADHEETELNQAWLAYSTGQTTATAGRQRLVIDNARFVGDSAWRQNAQTFDGLVLTNKSLSHTTLTYAWLYRINRVQGNVHAQGNWDSDSHLFNASFTGLEIGTITSYAYLLDFDNAAAQSCATFGASFTGATPLNTDFKLSYRIEYAHQNDYRSSPLNYSTGYSAVELGIFSKPGGIALGCEQFNSDRGVSIRTPLATLHAFNGWADLFSATPANGLKDTYLKVSANLPGTISFLGFYHEFAATRLGVDYGTEVDLQLTRKFGSRVTGLLKYANFKRDNAAFPDVEKIWAQVEFAY